MPHRAGNWLCLLDHAADLEDAFSEFRTGLDHLHLESLVPSRADLEAWASRLDELGIRHSGIKLPSYTANAMITF